MAILWYFGGLFPGVTSQVCIVGQTYFKVEHFDGGETDLRLCGCVVQCDPQELHIKN